MMQPSELTFVHKPFIPGPHATKRRLFDMSSVYRVMAVVATADDDVDLVDVIMPASEGDRKGVRVYDALRVFYTGAEEDLDRYLAWLTSGALKAQYQLTPQLFVVRQPTVEVYEEWYDTYVLAAIDQCIDPPKIVPVFPGQIGSTVTMLSWPDPMSVAARSKTARIF